MPEVICSYQKETGHKDGKIEKKRNQNHWTLSYAYAGHRADVHVSLIEDKNSFYYGKYMVYCGAVSEIMDTFDAAAERALYFTHGGAL